MDDLVLREIWKGELETVKECLSGRVREKSENGDLERKSLDCDTDAVTGFMCQNFEERATPWRGLRVTTLTSSILSAESLLGTVQVERLQHLDFVMECAKEFGSLSSL